MIVQIHNSLEDARKSASFTWGTDYIELSESNIAALLDGKVIEIDINGGEYTGFIYLDKNCESDKRINIVLDNEKTIEYNTHRSNGEEKTLGEYASDAATVDWFVTQAKEKIDEI